MNALPVVLSILPLLYLLHLVARLHVDVPFGDQWELVPRLQKLMAGTLSVDDVWRQHNEHRPMFPILIELGLARLTGWNINAEIVVNLVLGAGMFAIWAAAVRQRSQDAVSGHWWLLPIVAVLVFSPEQWENWLWGWQIAMFLGASSILLGLWLLSRLSAGVWTFSAAVLCGVIGTYSFASGMTYWVIGLLAFGLNPVHRSWRRGAAWLAVGGATIASYLVDFHTNPFQPPMMANFRSLRAFAEFVAYVVKYLGAPIAVYSGTAAAIAGVAVLCAFFVLLASNWDGRRLPGFLFPCLVGVNVVADGLMTGLGRAGFGSDQAMASRYGTIAVQLWIAVLLLGWIAVVRRPSTPGAGAARLAFVAVGVLVAASAVRSGRASLPSANARMAELRSLRVELQIGTDWQKISQLYAPNTADIIRDRVAVLEALRLSVFRDR